MRQQSPTLADASCLSVWLARLGLMVSTLFITAAAAPAQVDPAFTVGSGANGSVLALAEGLDGTLWIGGTFGTLNGLPQTRVARLNANGTVDPAFAPPTTTSSAPNTNCLVPLDDGKVLVGCQWIGTGATYRQGIARLHADGSVDTAFDAGTAASGTVHAIRRLPDGKLLVGGSFTKGIVRLEANGAPDPTFTPGTGASGTVRAILPLPSGKWMIGGSFSSFNGVSRPNLCRLNADGSLDTTFGHPGAGTDGTVHDIELDANGQLLVAGGFTNYQSVSRRYLLRLSEDDGSSDPFFLPTPSATVYSIAPLADGRILIGGDFSTVDGLSLQRIALLHADGTPDASFTAASGASGSVRAVLPLSDGKALLGGDFQTVAGSSSANYAKILAPAPAERPSVGSIHPRAADAGAVIRVFGSNFSLLSSIRFAGDAPAEFTRISESEIHVTVPQGALPGPLTLSGPSQTVSSAAPFIPLPVFPGAPDPAFNIGSGAGSTVYAITRDAADRILLTGDFTTLNGRSINRIARLTPDGRVDDTFSPPGNTSSPRAMALQADGRILVGGSTVAGKNGIARLHPDGSLDPSFNGFTGLSSVLAIAVQPDGKILIGGSFSRRIARLHPDGLTDASFDVGSGFSSNVNAIRLQPDGKIVVGGDFTSYNGTTVRYVVRLLPGGGLDPTFQVPGTGVSSTIQALAVQDDGAILVGGSFSSINGKSAFKNLARLRANGAIDETFNPALTSTIRCIEVAADGRIAVGGEFIALQGSSRNYAALLHADGQLVSAFNTTGGPSSTVHTVLPGPAGSLLIGGAFQTIAGQPPSRIARLGGDAGKSRPAIASFSRLTGAAGERVTVTGSNLGNLTGAEFSGGASATIVPGSESRIELEIPANAMNGPITLRNAHGDGISAEFFTRLAAPRPVITSIPTGSVAIGSSFIVTGENFYDVTQVRIGVLTAGFTVQSATQMTVTVPPNALSAPLFLSGPGGTAQSTADLGVVKAPPTITSAGTHSGTLGQAFQFTLTATFVPTAFTATPLPPGLVLNAASGQITGIPTTAGVTTVAISATNEAGTTLGNLEITIAPPPAPAITSVAPNEIAASGKIIVTGSALFQTSAVTVGGVPTTFDVLSDTRLAVVMPAGVASGVVEITTPQGTSSSSTSVTRWDFVAGSQIVSRFGDSAGGLANQPVGLNDVIAIAAGDHHSLALRVDGSIAGWGANWSGQATPPAVLLPAIEIAGGGHHSLALQTDGTVAAWGRNDEGQCAGASALTNIAAIAAGDFHSLALTRRGTVIAWGSDTFGQCTVPPNLGGVVAIAAGGNFSVALKSDGTVTAWGDNSSGQTNVPTTATDIIAITAGMAHVVALKSDGTLIGWGANWTGQINFPTATASQIVALSAGNHHTVALRADGSCVAWGGTWSGQSNEPTTTNAIAIAAGGDHSLVLRAASPGPRTTLPAIVSGKPGQSFSLVPVVENSPATFSAAGLPPGLSIDPQTGTISGTPTQGGDSLVTVTTRNLYGISRRHVRLFIGPYLVGWGTSIPSPLPQTLVNPVQVAGSSTHCLALLRNGTVTGWGSNSADALNVPSGLTNVIDIAAGFHFSLALKSDGTVHAWGRNPATYTAFSPAANPIATAVVAIDAAEFIASALTAGGNTWSIVSDSNFSLGSDLIDLSTVPASTGYSSFYHSVCITRSGQLNDFMGGKYPSNLRFDRVEVVGGPSSFLFNQPHVMAIQQGGKLYELQRTWGSVITTILRPETSSAVEIAGGDRFVIVRNADGTALSLAASPNPDDYRIPPPAPQLTTDTLADVGAIAASNSYALAIKDPVARARFTSLRVLEGRTGSSFNHRLTTSAGSPVFSASQLPTGLFLNSSTGVITGNVSTPGTYNFVAIASYPSYFIRQIVSVKFTSGTPPVDIALSNSTLAEGLPINTPVGTLTATDFNPLDTFTYALATGTGSTDNSKFRITGNQLLTSAILDFEAKPILSIRIQVTDSGRNTFDKVFQISLTNVDSDDDDRDGLTDLQELQLGTNRTLRDTDQDGAADGMEISNGTDPLSATSRPEHYVAAWGMNSYGQCDVPLDLGQVIAVAAGNYHTLALKADGTVAAWGENISGACDVPPGLHEVIAVAAGYSHSVALKADGTVVAWGSATYATVPPGLDGVIEISADDYLTAALRADGQVVVWGSSSYDATTVPAAAAGTVHLAVGDGHILTLNRSGAAVGWGNNSQGIVTGPSSRNDLTALAGGSSVSLGITREGRVQAWGSTTFDALKVPADLASVIGISAGYHFSLATQADGSLAAWGYNTYQQANVPPGLGPVQMAAAGTYHAVALVGTTAPEHFQTSSVQAVVGLPIFHQLAFSGTADRFTAAFLPPGLSFDTASGSLVGIPREKGTFNVRVTAEKGFSRISKIITVACENPRRFEEWSAVHFPNRPANPLADDDGDAIADLLEYALHRDPATPDSTPATTLTTVEVNGQTYPALTYRRYKDATDVRWIVEASSNLADWSPITTIPAIAADGDAETVRVRDAHPAATAQPRFMRLKIEAISPPSP